METATMQSSRSVRTKRPVFGQTVVSELAFSAYLKEIYSLGQKS